MFEKEGKMPWAVEVRNELYVTAKGVIRQILIFGGSHCVGLNGRRGGGENEMTFELKRNAVNLVKRSLTNRPFELCQTVQMVGIIPIDVTP